MILKFPFKTPGIDNAYWHRNNIKILKKECREIRDKIKDIVLIEKEKNAENFENALLSVKIWVQTKWMCKNGKIYKSDLANKEKFLIDSIFKALEIDDKQIWEIHMYKIDSPIELTHVKILKLKDGL